MLFRSDLNSLLLNPTQENDNLVSYENNSVIVDALGGDDSVTTGGGSDTITGGKGNDTLSGGAGNDIYIFNIGDAKDAILDINGNDTLKFNDITDVNKLTARIIGNDLVIAIKESGIAFEELSDKVTILNYKNNKIENITLSDDTKIGRAHV